MPEFASVCNFCPNEQCPDYGKKQGGQQRNLQKYGKTRAGRQRFRCSSCQKTFTETRGTIFYRKRVSDEEIIETLAFLAEGVRISAISRAKGHKEDTILAWLREAALHAEAVEEALMSNHQIKRGQIDALWSYVGHKGAKKNMRKAKKKAPSGARP